MLLSSSRARPVLMESHGKELHDTGVGLGGEERKQVSGWVERVQLFPRKLLGTG